MRSPISSPNCLTTASGSILSPGLSCPPLRPDAPQPGVLASTTTVAIPRSARLSAADSPVTPAPITTISASAEPLRAGKPPSVIAVAVHNELARTGVSFKIIARPIGLVIHNSWRLPITLHAGLNQEPSPPIRQRGVTPGRRCGSRWNGCPRLCDWRKSRAEPDSDRAIDAFGGVPEDVRLLLGRQ